MNASNALIRINKLGKVGANMAELLYKSISNELMIQIKSGTLKENDRISERRLAEQFGVSRTVIRDVMKVLNEKGYLTIRAGKGHYIKLPDETDFRKKVGSIITDSTIPFESILEARELIERSMVELILDRVTKEELDEVEQIYHQMCDVIEDRELFSNLDKEFHVKLMNCCQNDMLMFFINTLNDTTDRRNFLWDLPIRENAQKEHFQMLEGLRQKDKEQLQSAFYKHICCIREHIYPGFRND